MNCTITYENGQVGNGNFCEIIPIPSTLVGFKADREMHLPSDVNGIAFLHGHIAGDAPVCPKCGCRMNVNGRRQATIHHIPLGTMWFNVKVKIHHYRCPNCGVTKMQHIRFRHPRHRITHQLHAYIIRLLGEGLPIVKIAEITRIGRNVIKEIDKDRLKRLESEGAHEQAVQLKKSRYILTSSRENILNPTFHVRF